MNNKEEKIPFPFQYLEQYLRGESDLDCAIDNTMNEVYKIMDEYIEKNRRES